MNRVRMRHHPAHRRAGFSLRGLLLAVPVVLAVPAIALSFLPRWSWSSAEGGPMMVAAEQGEFIHEITENGDVESASNIEIRCEVQAMGSAGTTILWIVPEGTYVKPGDKLVELDSSLLNDDLVKQQIVVANGEAAVIQAEKDYECAEIALNEYCKGTYLQERTGILNERIVALENAERAKDYAEYSERLAAKGFVTKLQLAADQFAVKKAAQDLELANRKLKVLEEYTFEKMKKQLEASIKTCEAKLKAAQDSHKLDADRLELIKTQIKKCILTSPEAGQVVYASQAESRGNTQVIIEEGATVRERQVIIRLPDPKRMQVKAKINEAKISQVVVGMPATLRVDAFPDTVMIGSVKKVDEYPAPTSWYNTRVKEYETTIKIDNPPPGLRAGLTAEVKIRVAQVKDAVQLPVQAIFEHGGRHYCILRDGKDWKAQRIEIGRTNDKFVIIRDGLQQHQQVVLNSAGYRDRVTLPELPPEEKGGPAGSSPGEAVAQTKAEQPRSEQPRSEQPSPEQPGAERAVAQASLPGASSQPTPERSAQSDPGNRSSQMFEMLDRNKDGKIQRDELPENLRAGFSVVDKNQDGMLDRAEAMAAMRLLRGERGGERRRGGDAQRAAPGGERSGGAS